MLSIVRPRFVTRLLSVLIIALGLLLTACSAVGPLVEDPAAFLLNSDDQVGNPTPTQASPTLVSPPTATPDPDTVVEVRGASRPLTVWVPPDLMPSGETTGGQALLEQVATFDEDHPDLQVEFYAKRTQGPGSTLAYLRTAPPVAPSVMPDIVLLNREALVAAHNESLIVSIDELVDPAVVQELYPAAEELATVNETLVGLPYILDLHHAVYRETLFEEPPTSFADVLESTVPYVFPAGPAGSVNRTLLQQYRAAGGTYVDQDGNPALDVDALRRVLTFYATANDAGRVNTVLFQISDPAETWGMYQSGEAGFSTVSATEYLSNRDELLAATGLVTTPTETGTPFALVDGWMWVVVTNDPERQSAAMLLLNYLMNPVNQGAYTQAAGWLPTQRTALNVWGDTDNYVSFANTLLNNAEPVPDQGLLDVVGSALQMGFENVLLNGMLPVQAATSAQQFINPDPRE